MSAPLFEFRALPARKFGHSLYLRFGKRAFDLAVVLLLLPVVLPVLLICLAATALLSPGLPLYSQSRVGRGGEPFRCWKIRTMVPNADLVLERLLLSDPALACEWAENQKLANDPRITRFGSVLRRTSLDELPQLWNVLNGTMSLVGPRPFLPEQRSLYLCGSPDAAYYRLRPGITGPWQISVRNSGSFATRASHDTDYAHSAGFGRDLRILWRTALVVFRGTGM